MPRLKNKKCLITGAAQGIGLAIAHAYAREGATVWITDKNDQLGSKVASAMGLKFANLDVRHEQQWVDVIAETGALDVLINNAGITGFEENNTGPHDPENASLKDWRAVHETNLDGVFLGCCLLYTSPSPRDQRGSRMPSSA